MTDNAKAMVMASFAADALSLGAHWIYDQEKIEHQFGKIDTMTAPSANSFHPNKSAGEFTHYGDQTLVLLESIAQSGTFDSDHFAQSWQALFADYNGYVDKATKATLSNLKNGRDSKTCGSLSTDLGGAARIAPLVYRFQQDQDRLLHSVKAQTIMTHNNDLVLECAAFFAEAAVKTLSGVSPIDALLETSEALFSQSPVSMLVQKGYASRNDNTREVIANFGQMCDSSAAFPGVIHLICKYSEDLSSALSENVMAGGDSAARGMLIGMILGSYHGMRSIPSHWLEQMAAGSEIENFLLQIDGR